MSEDADHPRIETNETGYREYLRNHPQREHLRRCDVAQLTLPFTVIYNRTKFEADKSHARSPSRHAVATRSFDPNTGRWYFHILPNGPKPNW